MGTEDEGGCLHPLPPGVGTGPSPGTLRLQGEGLSADWTPPAHSHDAGPHCGRNCATPRFHHCMALTVHLQSFGSTRALDLAHSDRTLPLSPVAQYSHSLGSKTPRPQ
ncbi:hypothetical protein VULLAG_LOCUS17872 [Vulpes lagopus]